MQKLKNKGIKVNIEIRIELIETWKNLLKSE